MPNFCVFCRVLCGYRCDNPLSNLFDFRLRHAACRHRWRAEAQAAWTEWRQGIVRDGVGVGGNAAGSQPLLGSFAINVKAAVNIRQHQVVAGAARY